MYEKKQSEGTWLLSDIARFVGHDPKTVKKDTDKKGFPKPIEIGCRKYWKRSQVEKYYSKLK